MAFRVQLYRSIYPLVYVLCVEVEILAISSNGHTLWKSLDINCFPLSENNIFGRSIYVRPEFQKGLSDIHRANAPQWFRLDQFSEPVRHHVGVLEAALAFRMWP